MPNPKTNSNQEMPVVFLDRDGTLNVEIGYIHRLDDLVLIPGAAQAVKRLNEAGIAAILITNQSGAARNYYPESHIQELHKRLENLLAEQDAFLDAIYYCPHLPNGSNPELTKICSCRKPATGLIDRAYQQHSQLSRKKSFMVGDKEADIGLALNCKIPSILVKTGYGDETLILLKEQNIKPDFIATDISQAVDLILQKFSAATD